MCRRLMLGAVKHRSQWSLLPYPYCAVLSLRTDVPEALGALRIGVEPAIASGRCWRGGIGRGSRGGHKAKRRASGHRSSRAPPVGGRSRPSPCRHRWPVARTNRNIALRATGCRSARSARHSPAPRAARGGPCVHQVLFLNDVEQRGWQAHPRSTRRQRSCPSRRPGSGQQANDASRSDRSKNELA